MPADSLAPDLKPTGTYEGAAPTASPALIAAALAQLSEGVIVTDAGGRIQFVNAAAERLHGVARLDVGVDDYAPTYHLLTEDGHAYPNTELPLARAVLRGETVVDARWRIRRPDGSEILAIGSARPVLSAAGEPLGAVLTLRDDTTRVDAERADRRAARILAQMADEHLTMDRDFRILTLNDAALRGLGVPASAIVGLTHWEAFPASVGTPLEEAYRRVMTERVERRLSYHYTGDGYDRHLEVEAYPTDDGGIALFWRDVSARVRAEEAERSAANELRQLGAALQEQNALLQEQAVELELSNEQLQEQAGELEAQSSELEAATAVLARRSDEADRARAAAEESARLFRTLANAIPTLAWTAQANGYIDWYNARWYEYTGTVPEQMEGWGWQSVHDPVRLPAVMASWTASIASGREFEMTFPLLGADGRFRPFLTRIIPVRDASGTITRWFGTNTDVEAAVADAERGERLQALTAALAAAVTVTQVADVVIAATATGAHATSAVLLLRTPGTPADEGLSARQSAAGGDLMPDDDGRYTLALADPEVECLRTGDAIFVERRDGPESLVARFPGAAARWERRGTHAVAVLPLLAAGEVTGALSFTFDAPRTFTDGDRAFFGAAAQQTAQALERARLLEAERSARAAAEAANQVKAEFLSTMSHELRTPLNAIGGYAELLQMELRGPVTEAQSVDLGRIRSASQHLQSLINDILNFARLEAGQVHFDPQDVLVSDALADVVTLMLPQLQERGLEQECEPALPEALRVRADPEKLRQILLNLITNAVKFTASGGRIRLECASGTAGDAPRVLLRVSDTGRGIAADQLGRIFEPFVQVDRHLTRASQQGVGLGLAISRDLARAMGGDLTVESTLGAGSTFTLSLPRA